MSDDRHPDLDLFYDSLTGDEDIQHADWGDDLDDGDYELNLGGEDDDDEEMDMDLEDELDREGMNDEDDEEGGEEEEEEGGNATLLNENGMPIELEEDENGNTFLNLAALLNSAGRSGDVQSSLLARLLAGPASGTRLGGGGLLRRMGGQSGGSALGAEERAKAVAEKRKKERWWTPQVDPHPRGVELLQSGEFGRVGDWRVGNRRRMNPSYGGRRAWLPPAQVRDQSSSFSPQYSSLLDLGYSSQYKWNHCRFLSFHTLCGPIRRRRLRSFL